MLPITEIQSYPSHARGSLLSSFRVMRKSCRPCDCYMLFAFMCRMLICAFLCNSLSCSKLPQIARFIGITWSPPGWAPCWPYILVSTPVIPLSGVITHFDRATPRRFPCLVSRKVIICFSNMIKRLKRTFRYKSEGFCIIYHKKHKLNSENFGIYGKCSSSHHGIWWKKYLLIPQRNISMVSTNISWIYFGLTIYHMKYTHGVVSFLSLWLYHISSI